MKNAGPRGLRPQPTVGVPVRADHADCLTAGTRGFSRSGFRRAVDGRDQELESCASPVARGDPDPAAERALYDQPAEIKPKPEPTLRAVSSSRSRLLEQPVEARGREARAVV